MKLILCNGCKTVKLGEFIKENTIYITQEFNKNSLRKPPLTMTPDTYYYEIKPFELILINIDDNSINFEKLRKSNQFDEIVYIGE